jgi:hypothetical protein
VFSLCLVKKLSCLSRLQRKFAASLSVASLRQDIHSVLVYIVQRLCQLINGTPLFSLLSVICCSFPPFFIYFPVDCFLP